MQITKKMEDKNEDENRILPGSTNGCGLDDKHIMFGTINIVSIAAKDYLVKCVRNIIHLYKKHGFKIKITYIDEQFEALTVHVDSIHIELNMISNC